jgi:hypothetical protein
VAFLSIDDNAAGRAQRTIVVGLRNWLHLGSCRGSRTAAVLIIQTATCNAFGVEPYAYLQDLPDRISKHPCRRINRVVLVSLEETARSGRAGASLAVIAGGDALPCCHQVPFESRVPAVGRCGGMVLNPGWSDRPRSKARRSDRGGTVIDGQRSIACAITNPAFSRCIKAQGL